MLPLREQGYRAAFPQKRKTLSKQGLERSDGAGGDDVHRTLEGPHQLLDAHDVYVCGHPDQALSLAQEYGLFPMTFNEMNMRPGPARKGAGNHQPRKAAPGPKIDPSPR